MEEITRIKLKEKFLSRAGKEILLKSVIQAIPTHLMGVYKLLVSVIQRIHSIMAGFWLGQNGDKQDSLEELRKFVHTKMLRKDVET